jgi:SAM-dependent methyltransferase
MIRGVLRRIVDEERIARMSSGSIASATTRGSAEDYRSHVGPADSYDRMSAMQFNLLTYLGLRESHYLLDLGCGSLRAGRLFIPYLLSGRYFGIEPEKWLLEDGIRREIGQSIIDLKHPSFDFNSEFRLSVFNRNFDFIMAQSIFSHTTADQIAHCAAEAKKVLNKEGIFTASFFEGTRNYTGDKWTVKATFTLDRMKQLFAEAGLNCEPLEWPHTDLQKWLIITQPGTKLEIPAMTNTWRILQLEEQVKDLTRQRDSLYNHPWTRLGMKLHVLKIFLDFKRRELARRIRRPN